MTGWIADAKVHSRKWWFGRVSEMIETADSYTVTSHHRVADAENLRKLRTIVPGRAGRTHSPCHLPGRSADVRAGSLRRVRLAVFRSGGCSIPVGVRLRYLPVPQGGRRSCRQFREVPGIYISMVVASGFSFTKHNKTIAMRMTGTM